MIVSVAYYAENEEIKKSVLLSDSIRHEALRRLCAIPSYDCKSLKWKNRYYDYFKQKVEKELADKL